VKCQFHISQWDNEFYPNLTKILNKEQLLNREILDGDFTVVTLNVPLKWNEIYFHTSSIVRCKVYAHSPNFVHIWQINYLTENLCICHVKNRVNWKLFSYLQQIPPNLRKDLKFCCCLGREALCIFRVQLKVKNWKYCIIQSIWHSQELNIGFCVLYNVVNSKCG
jgi:hypothetical protein